MCFLLVCLCLFLSNFTVQCSISYERECQPFKSNKSPHKDQFEKNVQCQYLIYFTNVIYYCLSLVSHGSIHFFQNMHHFPLKIRDGSTRISETHHIWSMTNSICQSALRLGNSIRIHKCRCSPCTLLPHSGINDVTLLNVATFKQM